MDAKKDRPEFQSWHSFQEFTRLVRHGRRYVWTKEMKAFLDTVLATMDERIVKISQGTLLFRAQQGVRYEPTTDDEGNEIGEERVGYGAERMKPLANRAKEGRINPAGIPVLYLASSVQAAISETRPWVGSELSVAQFEVLRDLTGCGKTLSSEAAS
ncbi:RES family NAD+ phosphorylase [Magnetospirillum sulfuroxidans]|uniref:RES domain-containing protein n=1 Tax=Magnetospirillum sulfuroxidans TaxID=611300 RepID=A0ABS5IJQ3_9PROT|nr:RES family NAD+ phosphorylase [Magnetospirillum sulfuroxidans]MBR9973923.1 RES domain-containing protein [Magnetospirillum sulfuroxidans]